MKYLYAILLMMSACSATPKEAMDLSTITYDSSLDGNLVKDYWGDDHSVYLEKPVKTKPKKAVVK